ncbi:DUF481 domain-containing protein [Vulgatibacter incomptus]|uniref:DUF481 domain-containing protein n=1 Tax=Vulgatibacter incomptus TaxID=1391653 RepID=A0A0K1PCV9_9BACT|nr:DUF481 domain-containing protein [Vulgatibacter incomptus]AKU90959.1 hypothetical protein AKJ08_1346 [Vulgatibacter incomptus]
MRSFLIAFVALASASSASAAPADELEARAKTLTVPGAKSPETDQTVKLVAELGTALARGNTETFHIHTSGRLTIAPGRDWVLETFGHALFEESRGSTTANNWGLSQRGDRFVSERVSIFAAGQAERDVFAGIKILLAAQVGATYLAWETRDPEKAELITNRLRLELGGYGARENFTLSPAAPPDAVLTANDRNIWASRVAVSYLHALSRTSTFGLDSEYIQDYNDTANVVVNTSGYVAAAINDSFALKLTATHRFDNVPAEAQPPLKKNDFLLTAGLVVTL